MSSCCGASCIWMIDAALCAEGAGLAEGAGVAGMEFTGFNALSLCLIQFFPSGATSFPLFFLFVPTDYHPTKVFFVKFDTEYTSVLSVLGMIPGGTGCVVKIMFLREFPTIASFQLGLVNVAPLIEWRTGDVSGHTATRIIHGKH
ncbi:hypothetical protein EI94DRAFT_1706331 [Lactarius quietus]|nr:hypothetical protein EI94DRAFT_1706331 [Lactarius quietus]